MEPIGTIGWAVDRMRAGERVCRSGWNGKNMYLELQVPDAHSKMTEPYVYMRTAQGRLDSMAMLASGPVGDRLGDPAMTARTLTATHTYALLEGTARQVEAHNVTRQRLCQ